MSVKIRWPQALLPIEAAPTRSVDGIVRTFVERFRAETARAVAPIDNGAGNPLLGGGYSGGLLAPAPADDPRPAAAAPVASKPANPALARAMGRSARLPIGFAGLS